VVVVISLLGFDITHAVITLTNFRPVEVVVILGVVRGKLDQRSLIAYNSLEQFALTMGIKCVRQEVEVTNFSKAVSTVREVMRRYAGREVTVVLDLGGGLRVLVLETFIAFYSLPRSYRKYFKLVTYIEGQNEFIELSEDMVVEEIEKGRRILSESLNYIEKTILEVAEPGTPYKLNEMHKLIKAAGIEVTKQNLWRILKKLSKKGYVEQTERGVYTVKNDKDKHWKLKQIS